MIKRITFVWILVTCMIVFTSCGVDDIDISDYKDEKVIFLGLGEHEQSITVEELKELDCVTEKTQSTSDKIGEVRATGPLLSTVLESLGHDLTEYSQIIVHGEDEYNIKLNADFFKENQIILAIGIDGEALDKESRPIRMIVPESDSAYWVRMVSKFEFIK